MTDLDKTAADLVATGKFKVLKKLPNKRHINPMTEGVTLSKGMIIDTETTGLDPNVAACINIGIIQFTYDAQTGLIYELKDILNLFQEPPNGIDGMNAEAMALNNITFDMLKGKTFNVPAIEKAFAESEIVICHNAGFDRKFLDKLFPISQSKIYCCSMKQVPWLLEYGYGKVSLEMIGVYNNFYYDAHFAVRDCQATAEILTLKSKSGRTALSYLLDTLHCKPSMLLKVSKTPFGSNEVLKSLNFAWNPTEKVWWKIQEAETMKELLVILKKQVFKEKDLVADATPFNRSDLFKQ